VIDSRIHAKAGAADWRPAGLPEISARAVPLANPAANSEASDPIRSITFAFGLGLLVIRFSMLNQMLHVVLHFNPLLMYVFEIPVLIGLVLSGGIWRSFRGRPAYYWTAYGIWMAAVSPFSTWRSGSLHVIWGYWKVELPVLFVIAGLALTWRACRMVMHAIAWGGLISVAAGHFFRNQSSGSERLEITFGTVANANDYACVLLLMLPFVLWLALSSKVMVIRVAMYAAVTAGLYMIFSTGSRGAVLGLLAEILFFLYRGTMRQRMALLMLGPLAVAVAVAGLSGHLMDRMLSFSTVDRGAQAEAAASLEIRQYVLRKTIEYTITHPVLGLGPGQFSTYEGTHNTTVDGRRGIWMDAHNSYLQASSECGIPGLLFFVAGFLSSGHLLSMTYRKACRRPDCGDIRAAVFSVMLGMTGFCVAITFLNFAYFFYGPALGGLAIAMSSAAEHEFETRGAEAGQPVAPVLPTRARSSRGQAWTA
jgi:O-antigen ligase